VNITQILDQLFSSKAAFKSLCCVFCEEGRERHRRVFLIMVKGGTVVPVCSDCMIVNLPWGKIGMEVIDKKSEMKLVGAREVN